MAIKSKFGCDTNRQPAVLLPIVGYSGWFPGKITGMHLTSYVFSKDSRRRNKSSTKKHQHKTAAVGPETTCEFSDLSAFTSTQPGQVSIGYTGWYSGKIGGVIGKASSPPMLISKGIPSPIPTIREEFDTSRSTSNEWNKISDVHKLIQRIRNILLQNQIDSIAVIHARLQQKFQKYDRRRIFLISISDFYDCLLQFNINLSKNELNSVCSRFDEGGEGMARIRYKEFLQKVFPEIYN